jgi:hypothetical protein
MLSPGLSSYGSGAMPRALSPSLYLHFIGVHGDEPERPEQAPTARPHGPHGGLHANDKSLASAARARLPGRRARRRRTPQVTVAPRRAPRRPRGAGGAGCLGERRTCRRTWRRAPQRECSNRHHRRLGLQLRCCRWHRAIKRWCWRSLWRPAAGAVPPPGLAR